MVVTTDPRLSGNASLLQNCIQDSKEGSWLSNFEKQVLLYSCLFGFPHKVTARATCAQDAVSGACPHFYISLENHSHLPLWSIFVDPIKLESVNHVQVYPTLSPCLMQLDPSVPDPKRNSGKLTPREKAGNEDPGS